MTRIDIARCPAAPFQVRLLGKDWFLERHGDLESLWEAMGEDPQQCGRFGQDERLPYWVELWPSAILLGEWLGARGEALRGRRCLDLGCGLGLTTLAGASCGAQVVGLDYEWPALFYAQRNGLKNSDKTAVPPLWVQMDWREPGLSPGAFEYIWGADIMYERRFIEPVAEVLRYALAPGGTVWIAEPGRTIYEPFTEHMRSKGWRCEQAHRARVRQVTSPGPPVRVNIWEFTNTF